VVEAAESGAQGGQSIVDPVEIRVGSRPLGGPLGRAGLRHRFIQINGPNGEAIWEMGPDDQGLIATTLSPQRPTGTVRSTRYYLRKNPKRVLWSKPMTVSASALTRAMVNYELTWVGRPYSALSHNSNYAVNSVVYGAGGQIEGNLGYSPGFPDQ